FGAARQAISDKTQVFTAILKPSFAPIEQYAEATTLKQGPWTDFYALAAAMHELLTGRPPPPATARAMGDELAPLAVPGYSPSFLAGLDWALRVAPAQRPQTVAEWREVLDGHAPVPAPKAAPPRAPAPPAAPAAPLDLEFADTVQGTPSQLEDDDATVVVPLRKQPPPPPPPAPKPARQAAPTPKPAPVAAAPAKTRSWQGPAVAGGGVLALVLLGLFVMQLRGKPTPPEVLPQPEPAASSVAAPAEVPASVPAPAPAPAPVQAAPEPASAPASQAAVPPPPVKPALAASRAASSPARRDAASRPAANDKAGEVKPVPRSPVFAAPEQATPATPPASVARTAPASAPPTEPAPPKTAGEACGGRVLFARAWCIDRQCEKPIYQNDPECVKLREIRNSRNANH
ncbi:MAG TPA: hypothetical protein VIN03_22800, partial [Roseateles sp.]